MCIVLPQGRFNNTNDEFIRQHFSQHARILSVVSLNSNTFKPHTGTKTSILFLQKWNDDENAGPLCHKVENYPIFFAVSQNSGKDNSGEYIFKLGADGLPVIDSHGHMVIDHDLDEIATDFLGFAKKEKLSFI